MRVKYFQKGGGKFTAAEKKIYLDHCKTLCLGTGGNPIESREYLLDKLKTDVISNIDSMPEYKDAVIKTRLKENYTRIVDSIDLTDPDNLRIVNTVTLEFVILFTYASVGFRQPTKSEWNITESDPTRFLDVYNLFMNSVKTQEKLSECKFIKNLLKNRGIITIIDEFNVDDMIIPFLEGWFLCQLKYKADFADGFLMLPFNNVHHDYVHYINFENICLRRNFHPIEEMKSFYNYICRIKDKKKLNSVKKIFFLFVHEGWCYIFNRDYMVKDLSDDKNPFYSGRLNKRRILNENNLLGIIPRTYIRKISGRLDESRIFSYLNTAMANYLSILNEYQLNQKNESEINQIDRDRRERIRKMEQWACPPIVSLLLTDREISEISGRQIQEEEITETQIAPRQIDETSGCIGETCSFFKFWGGTRYKKSKKVKNKNKKSRKAKRRYSH